MSWWDDIVGSISGNGLIVSSGASGNDPLYDTVIRTQSTAYPISLADANLLAAALRGVYAAQQAVSSFPQATAGVIGEIKQAGSAQNVPPGFWDQLASKLNSVRSATTTTAATAETVAKAAADVGGSSAAAALKFLADNGNLLAKMALILGVSLGAMQAIAIGGGGLLLILFLKK